jgi:transcriptional regulator with XRE-family HTH domain
MDTQGRQSTADGPTHRQVAANVRALRARRNLSQPELSERLAAVGRPMGVSALSKIEKATRRVTVDDLVALALALGTNPNALLLPHAPEGEQTALTSEVTSAWWRAWQWAAGEVPLELPDAAAADPATMIDWYETTRPHKDPDEIAAEIANVRTLRRERHEALVREVTEAQARWSSTRDGEG